MIHRDIKPMNLMLNGENEDLVLVDFGVSHRFLSDDDIVSTTAGTYHFFAPEMVKPSSTGPKIVHGKKADIWAAGISLYSIATGQHPFE